MSVRLVLVTEIIAPYRIPVFNALASRRDVDLHVIFLSETDATLREWPVYRDEIRFSYQVLPSWRARVRGRMLLVNGGMALALRAARPDVIVCGGYNYAAAWEALAWAKLQRVPFLLWCESNEMDQRGGNALVERAKRLFIRGCDGHVVPGTASRRYVAGYGVEDARIWMAPNAVDNDFFTAGADRARELVGIRADLGLPERYFLVAGRLVREKGVFDALEAYGRLSPDVREEVDLVFAGSGAAQQELAARSRSLSPGRVRFAGFVDRSRLPAYYGLSDALVFPTHTDPWGLVVNEALACGTPVIASRAAGCTEDLITDGWNGLVVEGGDVAELAAAMARLAGDPVLRHRLSRNARERAASFSPEAWSEGMSRAVQAAMERT
jgi:glycosyltransferase involved in cell wall biosynthesis